jgi:predicted phosphodiesterase
MDERMNNNKMLKKIGAIGDIHGEATSLKAVINFLNNSNLDLIVSVGDITDGRESIDECCEILQQNNVATVKGNHDRWFLANEMRDLPDATVENDINKQTLKFLSSLPTIMEFETQTRALPHF